MLKNKDVTGEYVRGMVQYGKGIKEYGCRYISVRVNNHAWIEKHPTYKEGQLLYIDLLDPYPDGEHDHEKPGDRPRLLWCRVAIDDERGWEIADYNLDCVECIKEEDVNAKKRKQI